MTPFRETPADGVRLSRLDVEGDELLVLSVRSHRRAHLERLTEAERAVLQLVLRGYGNDVIARRRGVAERTVANQVSSIYTKLGVCTRSELVTLISGKPDG